MTVVEGWELGTVQLAILTSAPDNDDDDNDGNEKSIRGRVRLFLSHGRDGDGGDSRGGMGPWDGEWRVISISDDNDD